MAYDSQSLILQKDGIGSTVTDGLQLINSTTAAAGAQQYSTALRFTGQGWKTNATAASQAVDWRIRNVPIQGSANPATRIVFESSINGEAFTERFNIDSALGVGVGMVGLGYGTNSLNVAGVLAVSGQIIGDSSISVQGGAYFGWGSRSKLYSPSDSVIQLINSAATDFDRLQFGGTTSSFPALKRSTTILQSRLADDSAFASLQGKLMTDSNATTGLSAGVLAATTNATIEITDASGQLYRVPCII